MIEKCDKEYSHGNPEIFFFFAKIAIQTRRFVSILVFCEREREINMIHICVSYLGVPHCW